jgi:hypothetical protein
MFRPTKIDVVEVFDSEGNVALTVAGRDVAYLSWRRDATDVLSDNDKQKIIDVIVNALGVDQ